MLKVYSKVDPGLLLCTAINYLDIPLFQTRVALTDESATLQVTARSLPIDFKVNAHKHLPIKRETEGTQEAWVVIDGYVVAHIFDVDDKEIDSVTLRPGSCIVFFAGAHSLERPRGGYPQARMYEFKNGPYYGAAADKQFIE